MVLGKSPVYWGTPGLWCVHVSTYLIRNSEILDHAASNEALWHSPKFVAILYKLTMHPGNQCGKNVYAWVG